MYDFYVDDQTWKDLNLESIFRKIDKSYSSIGSEYLYAKMRLLSHEEDPTIKTLKGFFANHFDEMIGIQALYMGLGKRENNFAKNYVQEKDIEIKGKYLYLTLGILPCAGLGLALFNQILGTIVFMCAISFNIIYYIIDKYVRDKDTGNMAYLVQVLTFSIRLSKKNFPLKSVLTELTNKFKTIKYFGFKFREKSDTFMDFLLEYFCMFFMLSYIGINWVKEKIDKHNEDILEVFEIIGKIEFVISIMNYKSTLSYYCTPKLLDGLEPVIRVKAIYHPLLEQPVTNDVEFVQSTLISGDNASNQHI